MTVDASKICLMLTTLPDREQAYAVARLLVQERWAACVNCLPGIDSIYTWDGVLEQAPEVLLLMKTTRENIPGLQARLRDLHPYQVPEMIVFSVDAGWPDYLQWVINQTQREP